MIETYLGWGRVEVYNLVYAGTLKMEVQYLFERI